MKLKATNIELELMMLHLRPILPHRDKIGYVAARNTRILKETLTEFLSFKAELIQKYGDLDKDADGNELGSISIKPNSPNFAEFTKAFNEIKNIEHEVDLMTLKYEEAIGILNGEEILELDWMFED